MNQRWRSIALWVLPIGVALFLGWQVLGSGANRMAPAASGGPTVPPRNAAVARMSYGRFLDYVEAGRVTAVDIFDGGRTAGEHSPHDRRCRGGRARGWVADPGGAGGRGDHDAGAGLARAGERAPASSGLRRWRVCRGESRRRAPARAAYDEARPLALASAA